MLAILLAVVLASPSPSPAPPLKTIVTVKASAFCGALAAHLNAAITSAVNNDQSLGSAITVLHSSDLAGTVLAREREIHRLEDLSDSIYKGYRTGENEVKQLRELASKATDPAEKASLTQAADALGGALYRQHLVQRDLQGFTAFLDASDMMSDFDGKSGDMTTPEQAAASENDMAFRQQASAYWLPGAYVNQQTTSLVGHESGDQDVEMAQAASDDFRGRMGAILSDEVNAGNHIESAGTACSQ